MVRRIRTATPAGVSLCRAASHALRCVLSSQPAHHSHRSARCATRPRLTCPSFRRPTPGVFTSDGSGAAGARAVGVWAGGRCVVAGQAWGAPGHQSVKAGGGATSVAADGCRCLCPGVAAVSPEVDAELAEELHRRLPCVLVGAGAASAVLPAPKGGSFRTPKCSRSRTASRLGVNPARNTKAAQGPGGCSHDRA
jgi:hypothetical protein